MQTFFGSSLRFEPLRELARAAYRKIAALLATSRENIVSIVAPKHGDDVVGARASASRRFADGINPFPHPQGNPFRSTAELSRRFAEGMIVSLGLEPMRANQPARVVAETRLEAARRHLRFGG